MIIKVNGLSISLLVYAIKQSYYTHKQIQEMVNKYNKVNDKPVMVGEINLTPSRNGLEITGEIPVILNDADKESIINQVNNDDLTISNQIASSIKAIKETKSKGMLDLIGAHLEEIGRETLNEHETSLLDYAKKALDQQEKYIIKSSNNDDDFKVVLSKRLQEIDEDINNLFIRDYFGGSGTSMLAASVVLAIMILPTIIGVAETSIRAVPESYYEGSLA